MTHHVQEFIESTIDLIEKQEYYEVFTIWYLHYYDGEGLGGDYQNLQELFKIFDAVDIDLYQESESARTHIIVEHMYNYIEDILTNDPDATEITITQVIKHLNSKLSLNLITLNELFKKVARQIATNHNIVILPFKIQRARV